MFQEKRKQEKKILAPATVAIEGGESQFCKSTVSIVPDTQEEQDDGWNFVAYLKVQWYHCFYWSFFFVFVIESFISSVFMR